jgi:hypothetical protein
MWSKLIESHLERFGGIHGLIRKLKYTENDYMICLKFKIPNKYNGIEAASDPAH